MTETLELIAVAPQDATARRCLHIFWARGDDLGKLALCGFWLPLHAHGIPYTVENPICRECWEMLDEEARWQPIYIRPMRECWAPFCRPGYGPRCTRTQ